MDVESIFSRNTRSFSNEQREENQLKTNRRMKKIRDQIYQFGFYHR